MNIASQSWSTRSLAHLVSGQCIPSFHLYPFPLPLDLSLLLYTWQDTLYSLFTFPSPPLPYNTYSSSFFFCLTFSTSSRVYTFHLFSSLYFFNTYSTFTFNSVLYPPLLQDYTRWVLVKSESLSFLLYVYQVDTTLLSTLLSSLYFHIFSSSSFCLIFSPS